MTDIAELVAMLADLRKELDAAERAAAWVLDAARLSESYQSAAERANLAREKIEAVESAIKQIALDVYYIQGEKKPAAGVTVKMFTAIEYDPLDAIVWCRSNLPEVLTIDRRLFEQHAKGVAGTQPIPCVSFSKVPRVQIASNLGAEVDPEPAS